jgi:hypothetical protein
MVRTYASKSLTSLEQLIAKSDNSSPNSRALLPPCPIKFSESRSYTLSRDLLLGCEKEIGRDSYKQQSIHRGIGVVTNTMEMKFLLLLITCSAQTTLHKQSNGLQDIPLRKIKRNYI